MVTISTDYKDADSALISALRSIFMIGAIAIAYAMFHISTMSFVETMSKHRVLWNSLSLLEAARRVAPDNLADAETTARHLLDLDNLRGFDSPLRRENLESYRLELEKALSGSKAILVEFPVFFARDICKVALIPSKAFSSDLAHAHPSVHFLILPSQSCSMQTHTLLPVAFEFNTDGVAQALLVTELVFDKILLFKNKPKCSEAPALCRALPSVFESGSRFVTAHGNLNRFSTIQEVTDFSVMNAASLASQLLARVQNSKGFLESQAEAEEFLKSIAPTGDNKFMGVTTGGLETVPFLALGATLFFLFLTASSLSRLDDEERLQVTKHSPLFDAKGLLSSATRYVLILVPMTSTILVSLCFQDFFRRLAFLPGMRIGVYLNPLRGHFFLTTDYRFVDAAWFQPNANLPEVYFNLSFIAIIVAIPVSIWIAVCLLRLSPAPSRRARSAPKIHLKMRAIRMSRRLSGKRPTDNGSRK
jgi:hypothetical protein